MAEQKAHKRRTLFISLRLKLLVAFLLLFGALAGGIFYWFYTFSHDLVTRRFHDFVTQAAMDRLQEDLQTLLVGVSAQIDGDQFEQLVNDQQLAAQVTQTETKPGAGIYPDDQRYWDHVQLLGLIYRVDPRTGLYTYIAGDKPGEVVYIGSSGATKTERSGVKFRQVVQYSPQDAAIILGGIRETAFYLQIYQDEFGKWISGYTPIKNSSGKTVGALGIDFRAEYVERVQHDLQERIVSDVQEKVRTGIILATGITSIVVILMVFLISGVLTRPITALTRIAGRIGEGDYEQDLSSLTPGRLSDEIGSLAQVFEIMVDKVRQREERLKKQVIQLQIMIDEGKRQEQVEEIVDSDFFRDLQQKARRMRQGFASSSATTPPKADE